MGFPLVVKTRKKCFGERNVQNMIAGNCPGTRVGQVAIRIHNFAEPIDVFTAGAGRWRYERNDLYEPAAEFASFP